MLRTEPLVHGHPPAPWWQTRPGRAVVGSLLLFACVYALRIARPLLLPLVVSFLLAAVLAPAARLLRRLRVPGTLAAGIVVAAFAGATGIGMYALAEPATTWIERAPQTMREIERKLHTVKSSILEARLAAETVEKIARVDGGPPADEMTVTVKEPSLAARIVETTRAAALHAVEVTFLLFFLLAYGGAFFRKLLAITDRLRAKIRLVTITSEIEHEISGYLLTITCINVGLGAATAIVMALLGMPNPVLWGGLAAVLNFVPYVGSSVTLVVLTLVAILTFETLPRALVVPVAFLALATIEGQVVTPIVVGRRMALSPLVIGIALMVGAWVWGPVGMLIAVPVLAVTKIVCGHDEELAPIAALLERD